jgi:lipoprotein-anchoring transpeptidase ErfK/SrfK
VRGEPVVENQITWARLEDGGYIYARNIVRSGPVEPPPLPADAPAEGRWIDVHLTQQLLVAYEGRTAVRTVVTTTGMPGWETPPGWFRINTRVANETMESGSIGAENFYVLKDVLFTQYFTDRGHALHYAWWKTAETIGRPGSHGCLNLLLDDAEFLWEWAGIGTPVICRVT